MNDVGFGRLGRNTSDIFCFLVLAVIVGAPAVVPALDGDLDPAWDGDGTAVYGEIDAIHRGYGIALQCDGKVVVTGSAVDGGLFGDLTVARFNPDGSLDASFGTGGIVSLTLGSFGAWGSGVAVQPDGKIVIVGTANLLGSGNHFVIVRLTASGLPDTGFSGDGFQYLQFGGASVGRAVALQPDGRILVAGQTENTTAMVVARLTSGGELDSTFDGDGSLLLDFTLGDDEAWDLTVQPDGRILVVGTAEVVGGSVMVVARTLGDGTLDTTFGPGAGGATPIDFGATSEGLGITLQPDGKIVAVGRTDASTAIAVGRLTSGGLLDTTFSGDGMATLDLVLGPDTGWDVAMHSGGRILIVGTAYSNGRMQMLLARFRPDGGLDSAFGGNGYVLVDFGVDAVAYGVAIQPNDLKAVAVGDLETGPDEAYMAVVRVIGDETSVFADGFECADTSRWSSSSP